MANLIGHCLKQQQNQNKMTKSLCLALVFVEFVCFVKISNAYEVVYAVNAGGGAFTDTNDIYYEADPLEGKLGTASDFGKTLLKIGRVSEEDEILYQTERYHTDSFHYDIPVSGDGEYALVLKFSEVYFNSPNQKVFDVILNAAHAVIKKLDIFKMVGKGVAHDEIIYFTIERGVLHFEHEESKVRNDRIRLEFVKTNYDNPKINGIVLFKGSGQNDLDHIPQLQPALEYFDSIVKEKAEVYEPDDDTIRNIREEPEEESSRQRKTSGPKQQNPYQLDDSSTMLPIFIAIFAFVPLLYCLCKL